MDFFIALAGALLGAIAGALVSGKTLAYAHYRQGLKLAGERLLDRIDLQIQVPAVRFEELSSSHNGTGSGQLRSLVLKARERQLGRFAKTRVFANAQMTLKLLKEHCALAQDSQRLLETAMEKLALSARAYSRILKIARTIADLAGEEALAPAHLAEAIQYRSLDRKYEF